MKTRRRRPGITSVLFSAFCVLVIGTQSSSTRADKAAKGMVTHRISGCDYFLVETKSEYDLLEWYGGHDPDKGDVLIGNYESYGFHDIYDGTTDRQLRVWTEDYALSKGDALDKPFDQCK
jgi:hypothetical protein